MRIAIDGHMLGDHSGGNESFYSNVLREMEPDQNDQIFLFVRPGTDVDEYKGKFKIVEMESKTPFRRNFFELNELCKKFDIDVLHTQYFIPFIRSCKVVCTIHDICFEHYKNIFTKKEYIRQKLLIPYAARHSEYVFTVSEYSKKDIESKYHLSPDKIIVTYNAVNENFKILNSTELRVSELRSKYNIGNSRYILTVGNLQPRKNLPRLIEAFNQWKSENSDDVKLVIVGKKAWMYSDILKSVNMNGDILLTDYVSAEDLIRLYNAAIGFIYPSFFEGFGIPPLEAMACGTPVAVSNVTSLPEVVGNAGFYFDPFNIEDMKCSIDQLMKVKKDDRMLENMKSQVSRFTWKKTAEIIISTYKKIGGYKPAPH